MILSNDLSKNKFSSWLLYRLRIKVHTKSLDSREDVVPGAARSNRATARAFIDVNDAFVKKQLSILRL